MATFPVYADILYNGYNKKRESALLRSEMDSGPPKQARVRYTVMEVHSVKIYVSTNANFQAFETWYSVEINEGANWFDFTDPVTKTTKQARFKDGGYTATPMTADMENWEITAQIEIWSA